MISLGLYLSTVHPIELAVPKTYVTVPENSFAIDLPSSCITFAIYFIISKLKLPLCFTNIYINNYLSY